MGVFKDKRNGQWYYRTKRNGRQYYKYFGKGPQGKADAQLALAELQQDLRLEKRVNEGWEGFAKLQKARNPRTFAEAVRDYLACRANGKASSIRSYISIFKQRLLPEFGATPLKQITDSSVRLFQVKLSKSSITRKGKEEPLSPRRINNIMQLLGSVLEQEYKDGHIARNPTVSVAKVQERKRRIEPFSEDEVKRALFHVDPHYRPFMTVYAFTGCRPNELSGLRWSDIDQENKIIRIRRGMVRGVIGLPKTESGERDVPITPPVAQALAELARRSLLSQQGYVFTNKKGAPIVDHFDRVWAQALKKAGIPHRASYNLRHTFVTQCIIKGFPLPYIAKIIGHSTIDTLIRHYAGWIDSATKANDDKLRNAFSIDVETSDSKLADRQGVSKGVSSFRSSRLKAVSGMPIRQTWRRGWDSPIPLPHEVNYILVVVDGEAFVTEEWLPKQRNGRAGLRNGDLHIRLLDRAQFEPIDAKLIGTYVSADTTRYHTLSIIRYSHAKTHERGH